MHAAGNRRRDLLFKIAEGLQRHDALARSMDPPVIAHTFNIETSYKITPFVSVTPFYRYYTQTAIKYFSPYAQHKTTDQYYTSNYDYSKFDSHFYGAGIRLIPPKGVFGLENFNMLEIRYGHYNRNNGLNSDVVSMNLRFK